MTSQRAYGECVIKAGGGARMDAPLLSVLTPFHRHDPAPLIERLANESVRDVELVLLDDGTGSAELLERVLTAAARAAFPVRVVVWDKNRGRAHGRNRLIEEARGGHVLFLDADMIPDAPDFLGRWVDLIQSANPCVAFGGLSAPRKAEPETALHRFLFARSDCRPAKTRAKDAAQFSAASNLLVRRDILTATPFDNAFTGWGWEDVDWALRAARLGAIQHIDNPATHAGLDTVATLLRKYREAGPNYARLARKHPEAVRRFASYRAARWLQRAPWTQRLRTSLAWFAAFEPAPLPARHAALKLYRTAIYAEHLP